MRRALGLALLLLLAGCAPAPIVIVPDATAVPKLALRPEAATWPTYVLATAAELRPKAPGPADQGEYLALRDWAKRRTENDLKAIAYWNDLAPAVRWAGLAREKVLAKGWASPRAARALALVAVAVHDATVATWDARGAFPRSAPGRLDPGVQALKPTGDESSWPSEHAAAGTAAAEVLAGLFPADAERLRLHAFGAGESRLAMGANFPSDVAAGNAIGAEVARRVLARAAADGSEARVSLPLPVVGDQWTAEAPVEAMAGGWTPWLKLETLPAPGERVAPSSVVPATAVEPAPPPVRWVERAAALAQDAGLDAPTAARLLARVAASQADAAIATWKAKYDQRLQRPPAPNVPAPATPGWPSDQASAAAAAAAILADAFPGAGIAAEAQEQAEAGLRAGWDYPRDVADGDALGKAVAAKFLAER